MNRISISAFSISTLILLGSISQGLAADLVVSDEVIAPAAPGSVAGVVEVRGFGAWGTEEWGYPNDPYGSEEWTEVHLSGSARIAVPVAPQVALQLDAWARGFWGESDCDECLPTHLEYSGNRAGAAAHLAYRLEGGSIGGFVSIGTTGASSDYYDDQSGWVAAGLEGVATMGSIRAYGQIGAAKALSGDDGDDDETDVFAQGVLAYYLDPNLRISANAGVSRWTGEINGSEEMGATWGLRVEKKFDDMPVSLFVGYQGWAWDGTEDDSWEWNGSSHTILVGARFAFGEGTETLQDLDATVGLRDMNPIYGDLAH